MKGLIPKRIIISILLFLTFVLLLWCSPSTNSESEPELKPKIGILEGRAYSKANSFRAIELTWSDYYNSEGFRIYRSVNGADYKEIYHWPRPGSSPEDYFGYNDDEIDPKPGNTHSYYVTAYNNTKKWETLPSDTFTITIGEKTFLPSISLIQPSNYASINKPNYVFKWASNVGSLPYGDVRLGRTFINIIDAGTNTSVMFFSSFDDFITSQIIYNGEPLISGRTYKWYVGCEGRDKNDKIIAVSVSETREFIFDWSMWVPKILNIPEMSVHDFLLLISKYCIVYTNTKEEKEE